MASSGLTLSDESLGILNLHLNRLLAARQYPKTLCPSEVARSLSPAELDIIGASSWRELMPNIRGIVADLRTRDEVEVLQKGHVLDGELGENLCLIVGPIRIRKKSIPENLR